MKTKILPFYRGALPACVVYYRNELIHVVKEFCYLGNMFTPQLASTKHVAQTISKCNGRIAKLFALLPLKDIPLPVALKVFNIFIRSMIQYCLNVWLPGASKTSISRLNSTFTKYLKRFLGVPYGTVNNAIHRITGTVPLSESLAAALENRSTRYPAIMSGIKINNGQIPLSTPDPLALPEWMNLCPIPFPSAENLPILNTPKRALLYSALDLFHAQICSTRKCSHLSGNTLEPCICKLCNELIEAYHPMTCSRLRSLTVTARMKSLLEDA